MAVSTKSAERRELSFSSLGEVARELDRLEAAHDAGTLRATGNWTPGQVLEHLAILMECSLDGFPARVPLLVRAAAKLLKRRAASGKPPPAGLGIPKQASLLIPAEGTAFEAGMARLRGVLARVEGGERFTQPSPVFGRMSHEAWDGFHRGHCALHLGFLHPE